VRVDPSKSIVSFVVVTLDGGPTVPLVEVEDDGCFPLLLLVVPSPPIVPLVVLEPAGAASFEHAKSEEIRRPQAAAMAVAKRINV
jgi:hypothetical protein